MKVTAMLCNHAEAQNNMLYMAGAGIDRATAPPRSVAPWTVTLGVGVLIGVPWSQTNQDHRLKIAMVDADGHTVQVPTGPEQSEPLQVEAEFNIGRPPELVVGEEQNISFAINWPTVPLAKLGQYEFIISIDGSAEAKLPYRLAMARNL